METLKVMTEQKLTITTTTTTEETYHVNTHKSIQVQTFMSNSEDEGGKYAFKKRVLFSDW